MIDHRFKKLRLVVEQKIMGGRKYLYIFFATLSRRLLTTPMNSPPPN